MHIQTTRTFKPNARFSEKGPYIFPKIRPGMFPENLRGDKFVHIPKYRKTSFEGRRDKVFGHEKGIIHILKDRFGESHIFIKRITDKNGHPQYEVLYCGNKQDDSRLITVAFLRTENEEWLLEESKRALELELTRQDELRAELKKGLPVS